jgi:hypothetical protein
MKTFPAKRCTPGNEVHILSLGASSASRDWFMTSSADTIRRSRRSRPSCRIRFPSASSVRSPLVHVWDRIRACGGIAVFCHPYWRPAHRQYIPAIVSDYLLNTAKFDAMEILNGDSSDSASFTTTNCARRARRLRHRRHRRHSSKNLEPAYTLILAEQLDFPSHGQEYSFAQLRGVDVDPVSNVRPSLASSVFALCHFPDPAVLPASKRYLPEGGEWL